MKDRKYSVGDVLLLQEYDPFRGEYTGEEMEMTITYHIVLEYIHS
jgi:hypothetical protein